MQVATLLRLRTRFKTLECRSYYNLKRREKTFNTTVSVGTLTFFKNLPDR
ncbi:hypothetical protein LEP1GSC103_3279 [Leptospira borgpetersenii serovar Javanica str. UI 09931]|uniref:Uncharacterized protein n=1 Tax=Leptospira borgpetersenii serovar Javanica str. UI 09931 TaxID=1049767 RepID=A0AAV3JEJ9_LEPBO|nr:hypothetical protein LEP1GSC103_3279 [Leptospira borgpetersenii serovar Javanica str. UI 09931]